MDRPVAARLAAELAGAYPGRGVTEVTVSEWIRDFEDEDLATVVDAIGALVMDFPDRPPSLGHVRTAIRMHQSQPELPPHEETGYSKRFRETTPEDVDHWDHGMHHLADLLAAPREKRTEEMRRKAEHPETCDCDKRAPYPTPAAALEAIGMDVTRMRRRKAS